MRAWRDSRSAPTPVSHRREDNGPLQILNHHCVVGDALRDAARPWRIRVTSPATPAKLADEGRDGLRARRRNPETPPTHNRAMDPRPPSAPAPSGLALFGSIRAIGAITAVATLVSALATAATGPWAEAPEAKARIVSRWAVAPAGGDAGLGLEFSLLPGWHVYWKNSGDAGYPPELELAQDAGLGATTLRYPAPHRFELPGDLVAFGYEGEVVYPIDAAVAADATGTLALSGRLDYLVCREECIPYTADLALELPVGDAAEDPERAPALDAWRARLPIAPGDAQPPVLVTMDWHAGEYPWSTFELRLAAPGLSASAPDLFFAPQEWVELRRAELMADWDRAVRQEPLHRIEPLL